MSNEERMKLISAMGADISGIDEMIRAKDAGIAAAYLARFMGAVGMLAMEIDELNNAAGN
jgi:hypothetical protein